MEYGYKKDVKSFFRKKGSEVMSIEETYKVLFDQPMEKYIKTNPQELIDYISSQKESLTITESNIEIEDLKRKIKEPEYLNDKRFVINETSLELQAITEEVFKFIVEHANKGIKHLSLPNSCFKDISFLSQFPNLETLTITGYCKLDEDEIEFIKKNTSIKEIYTSSGAIVKYNYIPKDDEIYLSKPKEVFISGNITNKCTRVPYSYSSIEAKVAGTNINFDLF